MNLLSSAVSALRNDWAVFPDYRAVVVSVVVQLLPLCPCLIKAVQILLDVGDNRVQLLDLSLDFTYLRLVICQHRRTEPACFAKCRYLNDGLPI